MKIEVLVANPIIKSRLWQKHDITVRPCGPFALGTLSETCFKVPFFEINDKKYITETLQNPKMSMLTPKSKIVSYLNIILYKLTHDNT